MTRSLVDLLVPTLVGVCLVVVVSMASTVPTNKPGVPVPTSMWQDNNTAMQDLCKLTILKEVVRMNLPNEAWQDPALYEAMNKGLAKCLVSKKVMI